MGKASGANSFRTAGECAFCEQVLASKTGAQYHVQVQHGEEIAERRDQDEAVLRRGGTVHPYRRARATL